ncbi:BrnA antitoxin family protein [Methylobacterium dankookense]
MRGRRTSDPRKAAEAAFRAATARRPEGPAAPAAPAAPGARESVTLRIDSAVLEHFQKDGPGWQDRINEALKALIAR